MAFAFDLAENKEAQAKPPPSKDELEIRHLKLIHYGLALYALTDDPLVREKIAAILAGAPINH